MVEHIDVGILKVSKGEVLGKVVLKVPLEGMLILNDRVAILLLARLHHHATSQRTALQLQASRVVTLHITTPELTLREELLQLSIQRRSLAKGSGQKNQEAHVTGTRVSIIVKGVFVLQARLSDFLVEAGLGQQLIANIRVVAF